MAVYELHEGRLLRVARSVDGTLRQQYFSLIGLTPAQRRRVHGEAHDLDAQWHEDQRKAQALRVRNAAPRSEMHTTGVRGINVVRRPSPAFRVQVQIDGRSFVREYSVRRYGLEGAWRKATRFLAECRGYKAVPRSWASRAPSGI